LGMALVAGSMRVPSPAARITAFETVVTAAWYGCEAYLDIQRRKRLLCC
jgi:hypothetical protein